MPLPAMLLLWVLRGYRTGELKRAHLTSSVQSEDCTLRMKVFIVESTCFERGS